MPSASVFQVLTESGEPKPVGTLSYRHDWTYADARVQMEKLELVDFEFQFMDLNLHSRMQITWEKGNLLEDCGSRIIIIPKGMSAIVRRPPLDVGFGSVSVESPVDYELGSSNASNLPGLTSTQGWDSVLSPIRPDEPGSSPILSPVPSPVRDSVEPVEEIDPHVSFLSVLMTSDLKKQWSTCVNKLKEHMICQKIEHHKWKALTWDEGLVVFGKIECSECDTRHNGASKGTMTERSIRNCFTNFREKHLGTPKHIMAVAANRGEKVDSAEVSRRVEANTLDHKAIFEQHVNIVDRVNQSQSGSQVTFAIVGDVEKEPIELHKFKLQCTYCVEQLTMIPKQQNLETNLRAHCASLTHLNCVSKSLLPAAGQPILSGRPGRPRMADKRDV